MATSSLPTITLAYKRWRCVLFEGVVDLRLTLAFRLRMTLLALLLAEIHVTAFINNSQHPFVHGSEQIDFMGPVELPFGIGIVYATLAESSPTPTRPAYPLEKNLYPLEIIHHQQRGGCKRG